MSNQLAEMFAAIGLQQQQKERQLPTTAIFTAEQVARVAHETVRTYQQIIPGQISNTVAWEKLSDTLRNHTVSYVKQIMLALDRGEEAQADHPSAQHEEWMGEALRDGWRYGPEHSEPLKQSPLVMPWRLLPDTEKMKGYLFRNMVGSMLSIRTRGKEPGRESDA